MAGNKTERSVSDEIEDMKADLARLREDISSLGGTVAGKAKRQATDMKDTATDKVEESLHTVQGEIEQRPLTSVLIAFGVGVLVGKLFDTKS